MAVQKQSSPGETRVVFGILWTVGFIILGANLFDHSNEGEGPLGTWGLVCLALAVAPFVIFFFRAIYRLSSQTYDSAQIATTPVPSLQAIRAQLCVELGREPTLIECTQVQQALHNRKVEAAGTAIAGVALLGLIDHTADHL